MEGAMKPDSIVNIALALALAPLLQGVISRVKAVFAGRIGQPLLQLYFDLARLSRKSAVYSTTTTWIFRAGPIVSLACTLSALLVMPFAGIPSVMSFPADLILLVYLFGLMRFFTVAAALDTGSAFEGMGASREVLFSALAEPALLLSLLYVSRTTGRLSLSGMLAQASVVTPGLILVLAALAIVYLCENARIPFDDPNTHLELTMIHEVMVLDHSGPDLAFILYAASLKMWVLGAIIVGMSAPAIAGLPWWLGYLLYLAGMLVLAALVGVVESGMARLRLVRVPQLLVAACTMAGLAFVLVLR